MTDKKTEALRLALEYLRDNQHYIADNERHAYVMEYNAFVERLEELDQQPAQQQEPFCYHDGRNIVGKEFADHSDVFPLYISPPASKPLTDEQREVIAKGWRGRNWTLGDVIDAVEAAHGIKE